MSAIHSMTGYGRSEATVGDLRYTLELRALNHRYLDLRLKLPKALLHLEHTLRQQLTGALHRGRVELAIQIPGGEAEAPQAVAINEPLVLALAEAHRRIAELTGARHDPSTANFAGVPGVLLPAEPARDEEALLEALTAALAVAVSDLKAMRAREGEALVVELNSRLSRMEATVEHIEGQGPALSEAYRARLEGRLTETLDRLGAQVEPHRVLHEVAVFAEKTDVAEEIARLHSHIAQARDLLKGPGEGDEGVGRRLDFLFQEMNREVNTIGSKIQDVEISPLVVEMKVELERLREQVQNVE